MNKQNIKKKMSRLAKEAKYRHKNITISNKDQRCCAIYFEDEYAFVHGTIKDGDLVVLGGAAKIIPGKIIN